MNSNSFNRRLDKVQASLPKQAMGVFNFDYALFTPVEQAELQLFIDSFPPALNRTNELNGERLFQFNCWLRIERDLQNGDMAEAEKWRRRRTTTLEQLIDLFVSLDLSPLPTDCNAPGLQVREDNCTYSLSRTYYRHMLWSVSRNPAGNRYDMWRWIEALTA